MPHRARPGSDRRARPRAAAGHHPPGGGTRPGAGGAPRRPRLHPPRRCRPAVRFWVGTTDGRLVGALVDVGERDLLVPGGGMRRARDLLLQPVHRAVRAATAAPAAAPVRVELTGLGNAVGVVRAAAAALDHLARTDHGGPSSDGSRPHPQPTERLHA